VPEDLPAIHIEEMPSRLDLIGRYPRVIHRAGQSNPELLGVLPVAVEVEREDAALAVFDGPSNTAPAPSAKMTAVFRPRVLTSSAVDCTSARPRGLWR
jgi:hypothetical protein